MSQAAGSVEHSGQVADSAPEPVARPIGVGDPRRPAMGWTEIGIAVGGYLLLGVALFAALAVLGGGRPSTNAAVAVTGVIALGAALIAAVVRVRSRAALGLRRVSGRWLLLGVAAGLLAWLVNRGVILGYVALTGDSSNPQQGLADTAAGSVTALLALLAFGAVLVPVGEELLFRGVVYGGLRRYGVLVSTILSACLFGLAHGVNVVLPAAIILGVINAVLYERSGSVWPAVIAHGVNNAVVFGTVAVVL